MMKAWVVGMCWAMLPVCGPAAGEETAQASAEGRMGEYVGQMIRCRQIWERAAGLVRQGKEPEARELLAGCPETQVPEGMRWRHRGLIACLGDMKQLVGYREGLGAALWCMKAEAAAAAVEAFDEAAGRGVAMEFSHRWAFVQALVEAGEYPRARGMLADMLKGPEVTYERRGNINVRMEELAGLERGQKLTAETAAGVLTGQSSSNAFVQRAGAIVAVWRTPGPPEREPARGRTLVGLFQGAQDRRGEELATEWLASLPQPAAEAARTLLELADRFVAYGERDRAVEVWRRVESRFPRTPAWAQAIRQAGLTRRMRGETEAALGEFGKLTAAGWPGWCDVGDCLTALGRHAEAAAAYERAQKPGGEDAYRAAVSLGACLERLGRHGEAVRQYVLATLQAEPRGKMDGREFPPTAAVRIVRLYGGDGEALRAIAGALDVSLRREGQEGPSRTGRTMRRAMELCRMSRQGSLADLAAAVDYRQGVSGPEELQARLRNWEAVEASRLLAGHGEAGVKALSARLAADPHNKWVYYGLGLAGGPEAVGILRREAAGQDNYYVLASAVYSLSLAGPPGRKALEDLPKTNENLSLLLSRWARGELGEGEKEVAFPAIPAGLVLPQDPRAAGLGTRVPLAVLDVVRTLQRQLEGVSQNHPEIAGGRVSLAVSDDGALCELDYLRDCRREGAGVAFTGSRPVRLSFYVRGADRAAGAPVTASWPNLGLTGWVGLDLGPGRTDSLEASLRGLLNGYAERIAELNRAAAPPGKDAPP